MIYVLKCGCKNAICLDGGGSVYLEVDGKIIINTSRKVKKCIYDL